MKREWRPGDVAIVSTTSHDAIRCVRRGGVWMYLDQEGYAIDAYVNDARPVVVIDVDDTDAIERLLDLLSNRGWEVDADGSYNDMQTRDLEAFRRAFEGGKP